MRAFYLAYQKWQALPAILTWIHIVEIRDLSQIVISSKLKHAPNVFVFTEQGVAMLSSVLNSKRAVALINEPPKKIGRIGFLRDKEG